MTQENRPRYAADLMQDQVALVTGSGSGMGRVTALEMAGCGARLALFARRDEPLQETAEMIRAKGGEAFVVTGDTREAAMVKIKEHYGQLDVLVNNAGGQYIAAARDITNKGFEAVIRNNLIGSWQMTRAAADHFMYDNGGSVVFVTTISARSALTGFTHTAAARAGVTGMMKTLAAEWGELWYTPELRRPRHHQNRSPWSLSDHTGAMANAEPFRSKPHGRRRRYFRYDHLSGVQTGWIYHRRGCLCRRRRDPAYGS